MPDDFQMLAFIDATALPLLGLWALLAIKLTIGDALRRAERRFMLALIIISLVTLKTVVRSDEVWLVHMVTLAAMVMGAFLVPARDGSVAV